MRYHLRTLLIVLAVGPPLGAWGYLEIQDRVVWRQQQKALSEINISGFKAMPTIHAKGLRTTRSHLSNP